MSILLELPEKVRVTNYDVHLVRSGRRQNLGEWALPCRNAVRKCGGAQYGRCKFLTQGGDIVCSSPECRTFVV